MISVKDRDLGLNSLFRVRLLETGSEYFQVQPTVIEGSGQISVRLKENYTLDYENVENRRFNLLLEAKELKTKEKFSTTAHLLITVGKCAHSTNVSSFDLTMFLIFLFAKMSLPHIGVR